MIRRDSQFRCAETILALIIVFRAVGSLTMAPKSTSGMSRAGPYDRRGSFAGSDTMLAVRGSTINIYIYIYPSNIGFNSTIDINNVYIYIYIQIF